MRLKHATMAVLVCMSLSFAWALVAFVLPPEALRGVYQSRLPTLVLIVRDAALLLFFATLFKNQR